jgi:hypothetical protein
MDNVTVHPADKDRIDEACRILERRKDNRGSRVEALAQKLRTGNGVLHHLHTTAVIALCITLLVTIPIVASPVLSSVAFFSDLHSLGWMAAAGALSSLPLWPQGAVVFSHARENALLRSTVRYRRNS